MTAKKIRCRNCKKAVTDTVRCQHCYKCPICVDHGFLKDGQRVIPCYNCNPDGKDSLD